MRGRSRDRPRSHLLICRRLSRDKRRGFAPTAERSPPDKAVRIERAGKTHGGGARRRRPAVGVTNSSRHAVTPKPRTLARHRGGLKKPPCLFFLEDPRVSTSLAPPQCRRHHHHRSLRRCCIPFGKSLPCHPRCPNRATPPATSSSRALQLLTASRRRPRSHFRPNFQQPHPPTRT